LPLSGLAGNNPASCREKNTPTPDLNALFLFLKAAKSKFIEAP
jgi:hypothetical protein